MAKRKPLVSLEKDETENGFSMHVLHERPPNPAERPPNPAISFGKALRTMRIFNGYGVPRVEAGYSTPAIWAPPLIAARASSLPRMLTNKLCLRNFILNLFLSTGFLINSRPQRPNYSFTDSLFQCIIWPKKGFEGSRYVHKENSY